MTWSGAWVELSGVVAPARGFKITERTGEHDEARETYALFQTYVRHYSEATRKHFGQSQAVERAARELFNVTEAGFTNMYESLTPAQRTELCDVLHTNEFERIAGIRDRFGTIFAAKQAPQKP